MRCLLVFLCVAGLLATPVRGAAPDTLRLLAVNSGPWHPFFSYCLAPYAQPGTGQQAAALWARGQFRPLPAGRVLQIGYTQDRLWLRAVVVNTLPQRTRFVWSVYTHADSAALFMQPGGRGQPAFAAGVSGRLIAAQRSFPSRALCLPFWLESRQRTVLYLRVDSHNGALYVPTDLTTTEDFLAYETYYLVSHNWAWLLGLYVGSALLNLVLFAFLRDRIHLWYGAYMGLVIWFLLMEDGLDSVLLPQAWYRLGWWVGQYGILLLALACGLRVMALFLRLRQSWPRLHRLSWLLSGLAVGYPLAYALLLAPVLRGGQHLPWLNRGHDGLLWGLLLGGALVLGVVARQGRRPQRRQALLYMLTYSFFFFGSVNFLLNWSGLVNIHLAEPNAFAWGLALELLTFSILLIARFRRAQRQHTELRLRHLRERAAAGQRLIAAQDEEREALARELHDALAPGLTALHLAWQGRQVQQALREAPLVLHEAHQHTETLLRQLRHDVRTLSQALLPTLPGEQPPLPDAVRLLAETLSLTDEGPLVACRCDPAAAELPAPVQAAAYRIVAELLHNALRHAHAQRVRVKVRRLPGGLRLTVEDDGRGFDPHAPPPSRGGLGLRGIQARASYLRGTVLVSSQAGQGTVVTVDLPA